MNSFQAVVHKFELYEYADVFLERMRYDLEVSNIRQRRAYENYIYGRQIVGGLMCLKGVCGIHDNESFNSFNPRQISGSAFQKVNFLRDYLKRTLRVLGRFHIFYVLQKDLNE